MSNPTSNLIRIARESLDPCVLMENAFMVPDDYQRDFLTRASGSLFSNGRELLLCARQVGKSTCVATLCLFTAKTYKNSTVLCIAPTQKQAANMVATIRQLAAAQPTPIRFTGESKLYLDLENGSRIICLGSQPTSLRGWAARLVCIDEGAWLPQAEDSAIWQAVAPCTAATQGAIVALSSSGQTGTGFHKYWTDPDSGWIKTSITAEDCPRLTPEYLAQMRNTLTKQQYAVEYENAWIEPGMGFSLFSKEDLDAILQRSQEHGQEFDADQWNTLYSVLDEPYYDPYGDEEEE